MFNLRWMTVAALCTVTTCAYAGLDQIKMEIQAYHAERLNNYLSAPPEVDSSGNLMEPAYQPAQTQESGYSSTPVDDPFSYNEPALEEQNRGSGSSGGYSGSGGGGGSSNIWGF